MWSFANWSTHGGLAKPALWWLHIPKAGSSFALSTADYPVSRYRDLGGSQHQPLPSRFGLANISAVNVVAMFRQPEHRVLSSYFHMRELARTSKTQLGKPLVSCCMEDWGWSPFVYLPVHRAVVQGSSVASTLGAFEGCQVNMVLGSGCMSKRAQTMADAAAAVERVKQFMFVGLTEHWNVSVCLFNFLLTGRRWMLRHQLLNTRATDTSEYSHGTVLAAPHKSSGAPPGKPNATHSSIWPSFHRSHAVPLPLPTLATPSAGVDTSLTPDPLDGMLYDYVRQRFLRETQQHRIRLECCPTFERMAEIPIPPTDETHHTRHHPAGANVC